MDDIKRRIEEDGTFVDIDQLSLPSQCDAQVASGAQLGEQAP